MMHKSEISLPQNSFDDLKLKEHVAIIKSVWAVCTQWVLAHSFEGIGQ